MQLNKPEICYKVKPYKKESLFTKGKHWAQRAHPQFSWVFNLISSTTESAFDLRWRNDGVGQQSWWRKHLVDYNETRKNSPWIENNQLLEIRVDPGVTGYRIIGPSRHSFLLRRRLIRHAFHSPSNHTAHQHSLPAVTALQGVVGPTTAGCGPHSLAVVATTWLALKTVPDYGANSAAGNGATQAGRATCTQRACQAGAVETQEFVPVCCTSGVLFGAVECTGLHCVSAILEPLDCALGVVDL